MSGPLHPTLYQINTRVWLTDLGQSLGRKATLDDIPDSALDSFAQLGFDWIWLLGVWQTGPAGRTISRTHPDFRREFAATLPDLCNDDIPGSCFAISAYTVATALGGDAALARLRARLSARGLRLMLDFVPNHTAPDHPWVTQHPEYYVHGDNAALAREPANYLRLDPARDDSILAHGRDPFFSGWPDTVQLDYANPATQQAMIEELERIAGQCDGVRCDMAMLVLPDVFERTWGRKPAPFWPAAIRHTRTRTPGFVFLAEVYWDLEWTMHEQGFDYAYDKRLYDRLRDGHARPVRDHLRAGLDYQEKLARFLENHDEPRAAATFATPQHQAAATLTFLAPGLRFFHQGQFEGRTKRISPHLGRAPAEPTNPTLADFYTRLLATLRRPEVHAGQWTLAECAPAWDGNRSCEDFIAFTWRSADGARLVVAVNYSDHPSQCFVRLAFLNLETRRWRLADQLSDATYDRDGYDLAERGLYLDVPAWHAHAFILQGSPT